MLYLDKSLENGETDLVFHLRWTDYDTKRYIIHYHISIDLKSRKAEILNIVREPLTELSDTENWTMELQKYVTTDFLNRFWFDERAFLRAFENLVGHLGRIDGREVSGWTLLSYDGESGLGMFLLVYDLFVKRDRSTTKDRTKTLIVTLPLGYFGNKMMPGGILQETCKYLKDKAEALGIGIMEIKDMFRTKEIDKETHMSNTLRACLEQANAEHGDAALLFNDESSLELLDSYEDLGNFPLCMRVTDDKSSARILQAESNWTAKDEAKYMLHIATIIDLSRETLIGATTISIDLGSNVLIKGLSKYLGYKQEQGYSLWESWVLGSDFDARSLFSIAIYYIATLTFVQLLNQTNRRFIWDLDSRGLTADELDPKTLHESSSILRFGARKYHCSIHFLFDSNDFIENSGAFLKSFLTVNRDDIDLDSSNAMTLTFDIIVKEEDKEPEDKLLDRVDIIRLTVTMLFDTDMEIKHPNIVATAYVFSYNYLDYQKESNLSKYADVMIEQDSKKLDEDLQEFAKELSQAANYLRNRTDI